MPNWSPELTRAFSEAYSQGYDSFEEQKKRRQLAIEAEQKRRADVSQALLEQAYKTYQYNPKEMAQAGEEAARGGMNFPATRTEMTAGAAGPYAPRIAPQVPVETPIPKNPIYIQVFNPQTGKNELQLAPSDVTNKNQIITERMAPPPKPPKSLADIEAEAAARERGAQKAGKLNYAQIKLPQEVRNSLPSSKSSGTTDGAASTVVFNARRGKELISKATTPQGIKLASVELSKIATGGVPDITTLKGADYANTWQTEVNSLFQKMSSNPTKSEMSKLRKQLYDHFEALEGVAKQEVKRSLDETKLTFGKLIDDDMWKKVEDKEMRRDVPDAEFEIGESSKTSTGKAMFSDPDKQKRYEDWKKAHGK